MPPRRRASGPKSEDTPAKPPAARKRKAATAEADGAAASTKKRAPAKKSGKKSGLPEPAPADVAARHALARRVGRFFGAHVSAAGGAVNAIENARKIGATSFALFLKSQRKWSTPPISEEAAAAFRAALDASEFDVRHIVPHGSYLVNLCSPDEEIRRKSEEAFLDDVGRAAQLGLMYYNFHPGSTKGEIDKKEALALIAAAIDRAHEAHPSVTILLENCAGQGSTIGSSNEDIKGIIDLVKDKARIGVCFDTCHAFASPFLSPNDKGEASKDVTKSTGKAPAGLAKRWLDEFDAVVGIKYLRAVHLNDSKAARASGVDRHENLGKGHIGMTVIEEFVRDERVADIALILETPTGEGDDPAVWRDEINNLYDLFENQTEGAVDEGKVETNGIDVIKDENSE